MSQFALYPLLLLAIAVEYVWLSSVGLGPSWPQSLLGAAIALLGVWVVYRAKSVLKTFAQPSRPGEPTTMLITSDIFRYPRNPAYLGALLVFVGLAFVLDSFWVLLAAGMAGIILDLVFVRPEEKYLRGQFEEQFTTYCQETRRWL